MCACASMDEGLRWWSEKLCQFLSLYRWLLDAYVIEFFTEAHWSKLPVSWQLALRDTEPSQISRLLLSPSPQNQTVDKVYPLSLLAFVASAHSLSLPRWPPQQLDGEREEKRGGAQVAGLDHIFRRHVKHKKQHEIKHLAKEVMKIVESTRCKNIIDIGSGQGHLARYLAYQCGLSVVTVDAVGCHLTTASRFDSEVERDMGRKKAKGSTSEPHNNGSIVHIESVIQPDISLEELLSKLGLNRTETGLTSFILVGLHTCGELAPTMLRVYSESQSVVGLLSVGCCYMKLSCRGEARVDLLEQERERSSGIFGYPMSRWLSCQPAELTSLSYEAREVSCHAIDTYREKLNSDTHHVKVHCHRAAVETILREQYGLRRSQVKISRRISKLPFTEYATAVLEGLNLPLTHLEREGLVAMAAGEWREVAVFFMLRLALAPCVETLILLDRLLFLTEQGFDAELKAVFEPTLSPRNHLITSLKTTSIQHSLSQTHSHT